MAANIKIVDVSLTPNPVATGASLKISVEIHKNICLLSDYDDYLLADSDGSYIDVQRDTVVMQDGDNILVVDDDGELIETEED